VFLVKEKEGEKAGREEKRKITGRKNGKGERVETYIWRITFKLASPPMPVHTLQHHNVCLYPEN